MNSFKSAYRVQARPAHVSRRRACLIRAQQSAPVLVKADGTRYTIEKVRINDVESRVYLLLLTQNFIFIFFLVTDGGSWQQCLL